LNKNLKDKKVLLLGGLGFIGLNLASSLVKEGARVIIISRSTDPIRMGWLEQLTGRKNLEVLTGSMLDDGFLATNLSEDVDVVFNLAGESGASKSVLDANQDMQNNIKGNLNLLETVKSFKTPPKIIYISSRLVYGKTESDPVSEDHPLNPTSIYGIHKATAEHYYRLYNNHHDIPYTILRLTNPYGPYQSPLVKNYGILNQFIYKNLKKEPITIYGDGKQLRDYIYIEDVIEVLKRCGVNGLTDSKTFNLGYGESISLKKVVEKIIEISGSGEIIYEKWPETERKVETGDVIMDTSRIKETLNWVPSVELNEGLRRSISIYNEGTK